MKSIFKKIAFVLALAMVVTAFPAKTAAAASEPWLKAKRTLYIGGDATEQYAESAWASVKKGDYSVKFASADEKIATVNAKNGRIHAVSVGETVVTATFSKDGAKDIVKECAVKVKQNAGAVELDEKNAEMTVGEKITVKATAENENTTDKIHFAPKAAADKEIIDVDYDNGEITAKAAGTATVLVYATQWEYNKDTKKWAKKVTTDKVEFTVTVKAAEFTAEATGLREITVTGNFNKDSKFTVKKGYQTVSNTATVAEDGKSAVLALGSKLTAGVYTVSCGDFSADITTENEKVNQIVVLENGGQVTTENNNRTIVMHYDVLNQYGESVRKNYEVQWTCSTGTSWSSNDRENGILKFPASGTTSFVYGSSVILTGVHTATGNVQTVNASMTVGLANCVGSVEVLGVTKLADKKLLKELPAGFGTDQYALIFAMKDRLGYAMEYDGDMLSQLNFTSLSPLLVGAIEADDIITEGIFIDGVQYGAIKLTRGINAKNGGMANIMITANQTGTSTPYALRINSEQILDTLRIFTPDYILAKGDTPNPWDDKTIAYEATDIEGNPITDFRVLYKSVSFSSSDLYFKENNDGSAALKYHIPSGVNINPTKDYDIPMVYTATTVNGKSENVTMNIKAPRYAAAVAGYEGQTNVLEGGDIRFDIVHNGGWDPNHLDWFDQYDDSIAHGNDKIPTGQLIAVKVSGDHLSVVPDTASLCAITLSGEGMRPVDGYTYFTLTGGAVSYKEQYLKVVADVESTDTTLTRVVEFALANPNGELVSGSSKKVSFNIIDMSQCTGFSVSVADNLVQNGVDTLNTWGVDGYLANGSSVKIPDAISGGSITLVRYGWNFHYGTTTSAIKTLAVSEAAILFKDQSKKNADGSFVDINREAEITATVQLPNGTVKDIVKNKAQVGNYTEHTTSFAFVGWKPWITPNTEAWINATNGNITYGDLMGYIDKGRTNYSDDTAKNDMNVTVTITQVKEGDKGLRPNDILLNTNVLNSGNNTVMISKAEIGDTFVVTYAYDWATATVKFTVGADNSAEFHLATTELTYR